MSLQKAFEILAERLPKEIQKAAFDVISKDPSQTEIDVAGFSLWKLKDARNVVFILEKRATVCVDHKTSRTVADKRRILSEALRQGAEHNLWQAYVMIHGERKSFMLNTKNGEVIEGN